MQVPDDWKRKSETEREEWFLAGLSADTIDVTQMLSVLGWLVSAEQPERAAEWFELLKDELAGRGDKRAVLDLLTAWQVSQTGTNSFHALCVAALQATFKDRTGKAFLDSIDLSGRLPTAECLRRLDILMRMVPGVFCTDRTWGFGVVGRVDVFYRKVTIDFDSKPGHEMSFSYAAESLDLVSGDHLMSRRHTDRQGLETMVSENPAEVVRIALRSYGAMSAPIMQERLTDGVVTEAGWKSFWAAARKDLKSDPLVDLPAKRNSPIRLLDKVEEFGPDWFETLAGVRDPEMILAKTAELLRRDDVEPDAASRAVLAERLAYVVSTMEDHRPDLAGRALMAAECLDFEDGTGPDPAGTAAALLDPTRLRAALGALPSRELKAFMTCLDAHDRDTLCERVLSALGELPLSPLTESIAFLASCGRGEDCGATMRAIAEAYETSVEMVYWLCRNRHRNLEWKIIAETDLPVRVLDTIEYECVGDTLRVRNQLRKIFEQPDWLGGALGLLNDSQRRHLLTRVQVSPGWDTSGRRLVMARMIKLYPELSETLSSGQPSGETEQRGRLTSWRSYRERREQLRKLVEETIPENSREIGVARSYGDLRENFEYQAAKDRQNLLMRRKAELERDLGEVRGTDFAGFTTATPGMGTCVTLRGAGGETLRYCILGEWDREEALGIVSSGSEIARVLQPCRVGQTVDLPRDGGSQPFTVEEITPPDEAIRQWMAESGGVT